MECHFNSDATIFAELSAFLRHHNCIKIHNDRTSFHDISLKVFWQSMWRRKITEVGKGIKYLLLWLMLVWLSVYICVSTSWTSLGQGVDSLNCVWSYPMAVILLETKPVCLHLWPAAPRWHPMAPPCLSHSKDSHQDTSQWGSVWMHQR